MTTLAKKHAQRRADLVDSMARRALTACQQYLITRRKQQTLRQLSDAQLSDIGLTRTQARAHIHNGWFWE
ncbi:DUF1127 domain-containing protein [Rhodoferax sp. U11-2br]|nr:DUF1127 domain-containing protein [Rhodoferax sp. U11-2br]